MKIANCGNDSRVRASSPRKDRVLAFLVGGSALLASSVMGLIAIFLLDASSPVLMDVGASSFVRDAEWAPRDGQYNIVPMLASSLFLTLGALVIATPLAVAFAVYCAFYAHRKASAALLRLVDISAGMPTVIYGFWGLVVLVPFIANFTAPGTSILTGMLILALMVFPTIAVISHSAIETVPRNYIYASAALGVTRSSTVVHVIFHHARAGILAAMTLGAARAIGETVVVLMVCGNVVQFPSSLADPVRTLTANIALEMPYATGNHQSSLYVTGLAVLILVAALVAISEAYGAKQRADQR